MIKKGIKKFVIYTMILTLLFSNILTMLPGIVEMFSSYASTVDLENQSIATQHANVTFDAYFENGGTKTHSIVQNINDKPNLVIEIIATDGELSDMSIAFKDLNNTTELNYDIAEDIQNDDGSYSIDGENKIITSNVALATLRIDMPLHIETEENYKLELLNKTTKVVLNAVYTDYTQTNRTNISHEIQINVGWEDTIKLEASESIKRYVKYEKTDTSGILKKGVLVEVELATKQNTVGKNSIVPYKKTSIQAIAPEISGVKPTTVTVTSPQTEATNGKNQLEDKSFTTSNWTYDSSTGEININVENTETNGYVWGGRGIDEYVITYDYPEEVYNLADTLTGTSFTSNYTIEVEYYSNDTTKIATLSYPHTITLGEAVDETDKYFRKGYMYLNSLNTLNNMEQRAQVIYTASLLYEVESSAKITFEPYIFTDAEENEYPTYINNTPYVKLEETRIEKTTFDEMLGTSGYVTIYDHLGNTLGTIDSTTTVDNGYYVFTYTTPVAGIILETSTFSSSLERQLIILNTNLIEPRLPYTREQIRNFEKLEEKIILEGKRATEQTYTEQGTTEIYFEFQDTITDAHINITNSTLKETEVNEDVIFNIILANNDTVTADTFSNPIFQIDLPKSIENVNIKDVVIKNQYNNELEVKEYKTITRQDGGISILLTLEGTQTIMLTTPTKIEITTDITTKEVIPNSTETIRMQYYNEFAAQYGTETTNNIDGLSTEILTVGLASTQMDFIGTNDMACISTITNFDDANTEVSSTSDQNVGTLQVAEEERIAKMNLELINGYGESCTDIVAIGRIPFENNKYAISNEDLGSNFSTTLASQITTTNTEIANKITVYYSENAEATADLSLQTNGWTTTYTEQNNFKSYLIVIQDHELASGDSLNFNYDFKIPANVGFGKQVYANFGAYYTANTQTANTESGKVGLMTQQEPEITLEKTVSVGNNTTVSAGDILKYTITVKNTGTIDAEGITVRDTIPAGTTYVEEQNGQYVKDESINEIVQNIDLLQAGQSATIEFEVEVNKITTSVSIVSNVATATITGIDTPITSNQTTNPITQEYVTLTKISSVEEEVYIREGETFEYTIKTENISGQVIKKVNLTDVLPEGITYIESYYVVYDEETGTYTKVTDGVIYDEETRTINWPIDVLLVDEIVEIKVVVKADEITDGSESKKIVNKATITAENEIEKDSVDEINYIANVDVELKKEADVTEQRIEQDTDVTYTITLTNKSLVELTDLTITDPLSNFVEYKDAYIVGEDGSQIKDGVTYDQTSHTVTWNIDKIAPKSDIQVKVVVTTKEPTEEEQAYTNSATVTGDDIDPKSSNEVEIIILKKEDYDFDLSLDKTIKSINVKNEGEDYTNTFDKEKNTKVDIPQKLLNGTILTIEYEITVKNEGNLAGYARNIIDYIPEGTIFNQENNPGWTLQNGNLHYTGISDQIINPGESKTISLILKKEISESNIGNIINKAEIYEVYNTEGAEDINSTPNNQVETENDFSKAEVFVTIQTGEIYIYSGLITSCVAILGLGIYFIKKKVL